MTRTRPLVSVIVATRDCDSLSLALRSIAQQTVTDWECVIVDDYSTVPVSSDDVPDDPRFTVIRSEQWLGRAGARNYGIAQTSAPLIAIQDADDFSAPERLAQSIAFLDQHPEVVAVGGRLLSVWDDSWTTGPSWPSDPSVLRKEIRSGKMRVAHPTSMLRRDAVEAVGGYDRRLDRAEDWHLFARLLQEGELANIDSTLIAYQHPSREPIGLYCHDFSERQAAKALLREGRSSRSLSVLAGAARYPIYAAKIARTRRPLAIGELPDWAHTFHASLKKRDLKRPQA